MHTVGLHSALAIKRQRKRREEQKKARERRFSTHSNDSNSPRNSIVSLDGTKYPRHRAAKPGLLGTKVVTSVGMLHIGVVFLVFGLFLLVSGLLPAADEDASVRNKKDLWNELLFSGLFCICLGIFLIILNHFVSKKADDDLSDYVTNQLNRSKSGHRLVRDAETGHMTAPPKRNESKDDIHKNGDAHNHHTHESSDIHIQENVHTKSPISSPPPCINGEPPLEKIVEEDSEYSLASSRPQRFFSSEEKGEEETRVMESFNKETMSNDSTTASLSPGTPSETQELLTNRSMRMYRM
jgi:hypothetical protein